MMGTLIFLLVVVLIFPEKFLCNKAAEHLFQKILLTVSRLQEDMDCILFDADNDGDLICLLPAVMSSMREFGLL